jgi:hypothetical protein
MSSTNYRAWVFVSHSSKDLVQVRQVRNYLEERDASPILFHLLALQAPEEFWPLIDREIEARMGQARAWHGQAPRREVRSGAYRADPDVAGFEAPIFRRYP